MRSPTRADQIYLQLRLYSVVACRDLRLRHSLTETTVTAPSDTLHHPNSLLHGINLTGVEGKAERDPDMRDLTIVESMQKTMVVGEGQTTVVLNASIPRKTYVQRLSLFTPSTGNWKDLLAHSYQVSNSPIFLVSDAQPHEG